MCHAATVTGNDTISDPSMHVNSQINISFVGIPKKGGAFATFSSNNYGPGVRSGTCSAVYCHSNAQLQQAGAIIYRNMTGGKMWFGAGTVGCSGCHGYTGTTSTTLSGKHGTHLSLTANPNLGKVRVCNDCHLNGGTNLSRLNHASGIANYSGTMAGGQSHLNVSTGRCSTVYCHSNGQTGINAVFQSMSTTNWFSSYTLGCNGCHADKVGAAGLNPLSGKHDAHLNYAATGGNYGCVDCHATTVSSDTAVNTSGNHVNALKNFSGAKAYKTGFVAGAGTCSTYCHTDGRGAAVPPPLWTSLSTLDCTGCHAKDAIATGAHQEHLTGHITNATCANCHQSTTSNSTTITGGAHIDGTVTLQYGGSFAGKTVSFDNAGAGTCNNISCHSTASVGPYSNTANWYNKSTVTCDTCHPKTGLSGAHQVHMGSLNLVSGGIYYSMTANRTQPITDADTTYRAQGRAHGFGCAECHPMDKDTFHLNGAIDVDLNRVNVPGVSTLRFLNASSASYDMATTKKCANIYCHSNASRIETESNVKANTSLAWNDKFENYPATDRCAYCHGNQPTTGAHVAHAVSNHSDNIYNGKNGKVGFSGTGNSAHGNPNTTTTITCYICHTDTVSANAHGNDKNSRCNVCHGNSNPDTSKGYVTAPLKGTITINNLANHVNGSREIKFAAIKVRSKAQIRPESFKFYSGVWKRTYYKNMTSLAFDESKVALDTATMWHPSTPAESSCSNLACHNGYIAKWNMANWNDPNKCMDCHFKL
jgi:predicted CxxxxCH...CXXCH cytochrome family protein